MKESPVKLVSWVVVSLFILSTVSFSAYRVYRNVVVSHRSNKEYMIDTLIQTGPSRDALASLYLAELLGLSVDEPQQYHLFDEKAAVLRLLESPVIKQARVIKIAPSSIYVDYVARFPLAALADFQNRAIDEEGFVIPIEPFYSPKKLTGIYLGLEEEIPKIDEKEWGVALHILELLSQKRDKLDMRIDLIDLSSRQHESYGKREIVVRIETGGKMHYLRLAADRYVEELGNYFSMKEKLPLDPNFDTIRVIDLRIKDLAYVEDYAK